MTPDSAEQMALLRMLLLAGELDEARALVTVHLAAHPHDDEFRREQIALDAAADDPARWLAALESGQQLPGTVEDRLTRAHLYVRLGEWQSALHALDPMPENRRAAAQYLHIALAYADPNSEAGSDALERAAEIALMQIESAIADGISPHAWQARAGDVAQREWRWNAAISHYTAALDSLARSFSAPLPPLLVTEQGHILLARARCHQAVGSAAAAAGDYAAAAQRLPGDRIPPFMAALMRYLAQGMTQTAMFTALPACHAALDGAPPALADEMRDALRDDPRLAQLAQALLNAG